MLPQESIGRLNVHKVGLNEVLELDELGLLLLMLMVEGLKSDDLTVEFRPLLLRLEVGGTETDSGGCGEQHKAQNGILHVPS